MLPVGVSVGLAFAAESSEPNPQDLFVAADRALYNAKESDSTALVCVGLAKDIQDTARSSRC